MKKLLIKLKICWEGFKLDRAFRRKNNGYLDPKEYTKILAAWKAKNYELKSQL